MNTTAIAMQVLREFMYYRRRYPELRRHGSETAEIRQVLQVQIPRIKSFIDAGATIEFVLPAFPAKSPNPDKILGVLPDMAEKISIIFLNQVCQRIRLFYPPGATIRICSDGRVFGDLVRISDDNISAYRDTLQCLMDETGITHVSLFNLEDVPAFSACANDHARLRTHLIERYAQPLEVIRTSLMRSEGGVLLYRAITRFLFEDGLTPDYRGSRTALQNDTKTRACGVIQRSWAWGDLLADLFPQAIRLSIHPQAASSIKMGIHMMPSRDDWLTPWHGVAVNTGDHFVLMKRSEVIALGGKLASINGRPSHYLMPPESAASRTHQPGRLAS
ncbi:L-tyrosine/L-tryptophan isonitrile synthase family protein [Herbaspirillum autotrophicum]|uniref:L-tyrosine/L-tryptophan isonitrile synthase family protein n=1 Tax=Herbaspirillum autotrophicum TaxID=180195 RepID=UPI00067E5255|nr:L-tyrosine/L-tryptophan isonitrile synthase family protein [Herbaspirillum autotrophicum]